MRFEFSNFQVLSCQSQTKEFVKSQLETMLGKSQLCVLKMSLNAVISHKNHILPTYFQGTFQYHNMKC